jgi:hypothetical protein
MSKFDFGTTILANSISDFLSQDYPFRGELPKDKGSWRYFFGPNANMDQRKQILFRPNGKRKIAIRFSKNLRKQAGNPRVSWLVSKVLSTTTLVITDWETHSVYWDVYHNSSNEAKALTCLAMHNGVFTDWTLVETGNGLKQVTG